MINVEIFKPMYIAPVIAEYLIPQPCLYPMVNMWSALISPIYNVPLVVTPPLCLEHPLSDGIRTPSLSPISESVPESLYSEEYAKDDHCDITASFIDYDTSQEEIENKLNAEYEENKEIDPIEYYLTLPLELFPPARILPIDPNSLIDEFCKLSSISQHVTWILDLEFGILKYPVTRKIPVYSAKYNSINCKNNPEAVHPGFDCCSQDFKKTILFYYDSVISNWYMGYMTMFADKSVDNFQKWLQVPMELLGMCWI